MYQLTHRLHALRGPGRHGPFPLLGFAITRIHLCTSPNFFSPWEAWKDTHPHPRGCKLGLFHVFLPPLAWSDGPNGFSRSLWLCWQRGPAKG